MLEAPTIRDPTRTVSHLEHPSEVIRLTGISHVDHPASLITIRRRREPITDRSQVSGGVVEAAITLLHDHGQRLAILATDPFQEDALCPVVGDQELGLLQPFDHCRQERVVERLTTLT